MLHRPILRSIVGNLPYKMFEAKLVSTSMMLTGVKCMKKYCKAYLLKDLRQFSRWTEKHEENDEDLSHDDVVYLWDDFTVVRSPIVPDKGLIFDEVTPDWQAFCRET